MGKSNNPFHSVERACVLCHHPKKPIGLPECCCWFYHRPLSTNLPISGSSNEFVVDRSFLDVSTTQRTDHSYASKSKTGDKKMPFLLIFFVLHVYSNAKVSTDFTTVFKVWEKEPSSPFINARNVMNGRKSVFRLVSMRSFWLGAYSFRFNCPS